jgi:hypothetical protein
MSYAIIAGDQLTVSRCACGISRISNTSSIEDEWYSRCRFVDDR